MTNDQVWRQSTAIERCEILKSRLDLIETQGGRVHIDGTDEYIGCLELARLRRIEEAARAVDAQHDVHWEAFSNLGWAGVVDARRNLRAALVSEPTR